MINKYYKYVICVLFYYNNIACQNLQSNKLDCTANLNFDSVSIKIFLREDSIGNKIDYENLKIVCLNDSIIYFPSLSIYQKCIVSNKFQTKLISILQNSIQRVEIIYFNNIVAEYSVFDRKGMRKSRIFGCLPLDW